MQTMLNPLILMGMGRKLSWETFASRQIHLFHSEWCTAENVSEKMMEICANKTFENENFRQCRNVIDFNGKPQKPRCKTRRERIASRNNENVTFI